MADENQAQGGDTSGQPDPLAELKKSNETLIKTLNEGLTNLKAEFNRKIENVSKQTPAPQDPRKKFKDRWYEGDEDGAIESLTQDIKSEVLTEVQRHNEQREKIAITMGSLLNDYPELNDKTTPMSVKTDEIYRELSKTEGMSRATMELAVHKAAMEVGLLPKGKRKMVENNDDSFSLGGGSGGAGERGKRGKKNELSQDVIDAAQMMGLDVTDEDVIERLKVRQQRPNFGSYDEPARIKRKK